MDFRSSLRLSIWLLLASIPVPIRAQSQAPAESRTTLGGYGEVHYTNSNAPGARGKVNLKRFILYLAHAFNDRITFRSEVEIEDAKVAGGEPGGEVALEQAYLDFRFGEYATARAGLVLVPVGILNETHEPPTFNGVARPAYHTVVIPTTWRELGVGVAGRVPGVTGLVYRAYLVNGLLAEGFGAGSGIRGGRQEGREASFANPALTGRLEYARPGVRLGAAGYYGGSANADPRIGTGAFAAPVGIVSADARVESGPWSFRGEATLIHVGSAAAINQAFGNGVASRITGWYGEGAFNVLHWLRSTSGTRLDVFLRYERLNTQAKVPVGTTADESFARRITTIGLTLKPISNVAVKGDYQLRRNRAGAGQDNLVSLGVGYAF